MKKNLLTLPNLLSALRLILWLPAWWLALNDQPKWLAILILVCLTTDFLDGFLARKLNQATSFGAKLDSAADNLLLVSVPFWIYLLRPELIENHPFTCLGFVVLMVAVFAVMFLKFRRNVEIHTYASKLGVVVMWSFIVYVLLFGYHRVFFWVTMATSYFYLLEDLYLLLTRRNLDEHEKGVFF